MTTKRQFAFRNGLLGGAALAGLWAAAAFAQTPAPAPQAAAASTGGLEDIVVTARKREESVQSVPVAVTAISAETILKQDITSLEKLAALTPNFTVGRASNGSAAQLTLRGIGSSSTSIGIEQSVAVVVDGVYYGQGRVINEGFFDLERIEVLEGPQALFFGKNATAGVISFTTADPTAEFMTKVRAAYEFNSQQVQGDFIVSGPVTDTLGLRLAVRLSKQFGGWYENVADPVTYSAFDIATGTSQSFTAQPAPRDAPGEYSYVIRGTAKWEPTDALTATLKVSANHSEVDNSSWNYVNYNCANGVSTLNPIYECKDQFVTHQNNIPEGIAENFPRSKDDGQLFNDYSSFATTLNLAYELDTVTISSVTNYQRNNNKWACACDFQSSNAGTWATEDSTWRAISTELRALTTFDGPINFLVGGLYQSTKRDFDQFIMFAGLQDSTQSPENRYLATTKTSFTKGETLSAFGQVTWEIVPTLELAGGVRYTHETKDSFFTQPYNNAALTGIFRPQDDPDGLGELSANQTFNDWSPEFTLTWTPQTDLLVYAGYKTAYKSGGFSNGGINSKFSPNPLGDLTFGPETVDGLEGGIKSTLFDNQLRANLVLYRYNYSDLQVDFFRSDIFAFNTITADARTKGFTVSLEYAPRAVDGLNLRTNVNYNDAKYTDFFGPCYAGQTPAAGCVFGSPEGGAPATGVTPSYQDLTGTELSVAPKWTATFGGSYDTTLSSDWRFGIGADVRYSGSYNPSGFGNPAAERDGYITFDASIRVGPADENWQVAFIGKNLTNKFYVTGVVDGPSTGSGTGTPGGVQADQLGFGNLPRTLTLEFTKTF